MRPVDISQQEASLIDQLNQDTNIASPNIYNNSIPSTSRVELMEIKRTNYYISPIHSNDSDIDDSDVDLNFESPAAKSKTSKVVPSSSSSCSSSSSSSSDSRNSEAEDEIVAHPNADQRTNIDLRSAIKDTLTLEY